MTHMEIGERVRQLRKMKNYSREAFAEKLGLSSKFVYEIESGKKGFSADTLLRMSDVLSVSCDYILGNDTSKMLVCNEHAGISNNEITELLYLNKIIELIGELNTKIRENSME